MPQKRTNIRVFHNLKCIAHYWFLDLLQPISSLKFYDVLLKLFFRLPPKKIVSFVPVILHLCAQCLFGRAMVIIIWFTNHIGKKEKGDDWFRKRGLGFCPS